MGSALYSYVKTGNKAEGSSITEGIGNSRVTANMEVPRLMMRFKFMTLSVCGWLPTERKVYLWLHGNQCGSSGGIGKTTGARSHDCNHPLQRYQFSVEWLAKGLLD